MARLPAPETTIIRLYGTGSFSRLRLEMLAEMGSYTDAERPMSHWTLAGMCDNLRAARVQNTFIYLGSCEVRPDSLARGGRRQTGQAQMITQPHLTMPSGLSKQTFLQWAARLLLARDMR